MFLFRFAEQISVGDEVIIPRNDELTPAKVTNVSVIAMQGDQPFYIKNVKSNSISFFDISVAWPLWCLTVNKRRI